MNMFDMTLSAFAAWRHVRGERERKSRLRRARRTDVAEGWRGRERERERVIVAVSQSGCVKLAKALAGRRLRLLPRRGKKRKVIDVWNRVVICIAQRPLNSFRVFGEHFESCV